MGLRRNNHNYSESARSRPTCAHWYLGFFVPMYVSSLQQTILEGEILVESEHLCVLDIGVGVGTTALAVPDILVSAEEL